ncbi:TonB-dependent receptor domain-containing protein [candidate division KSB1 bacterium]
MTAVSILSLNSTVFTQGRIKGKILDDKNGESLIGANVILKGTEMGSATGEKGQYEIIHIPEGNYIIGVSYSGYESQAVTVTVVEDSVFTIDFNLKESVLSLREVVVSAGHYSVMKSTPGSKISFSKENIKATALYGGDIYKAVTQLPGVGGNDFSAKFTIRGGENEELLVLFDGIELYDPFHLKDFGSILSIIDLESVGGVDLITGGFPAEFGKRKSGVFNIKSESGPLRERRTTMGLSFMNGNYRTEGPINGDKGRWLFSYRRGFADVALKMIGDDDKLLPKYYDILSKVEYELNFNHTISAHFLKAGDDSKFIDSDDNTSKSGFDNTYAWLRLKSFFGDAVYVQSVLSTGIIDHNRNGQIFDQEIDFQDFIINDRRELKFWGIKQDWNMQVSRRFMINAGFDYKDMSADYFYFGNRKIPEPDSNEFVVGNVFSELERSGTEFGAYASTRFRILQPLTFELGYRYDKQSYIGEETYSPRMSVSYALDRSTVIKTGWGKFYQPQGIHELHIQDGDIEFYNAELAEHWVMGFEHQFENKTEFRLEAYRKELSDYRPMYINIFNKISVFEETSADRRVLYPDWGKAEGMELFLKNDSGMKVSWWGSYVYSKAEDRVDGRMVPKVFDQRHTLNLNLNFKPDERWRYNIAWIYHSGWPTTDFELDLQEVTIGGEDAYGYRLKPQLYNAARIDPYHRLDLRVTRTFNTKQRGRIGLYLELINFYNKQNIRNLEYTVFQPEIYDIPEMVQTGYMWIGFLPSIGITWDR